MHVQDVVAKVGAALLRRDARDPHLGPGERFVLDFETPPRPGQVVLVHRDGAFRLELAPATGWVLAVVRLASVTLALLAA